MAREIQLAPPSPRRWPQYNPWMIETAMYSRGYTITQMKVMTGLVKYSQLMKGEIEASSADIEVIGRILKYPRAFFEEYPETKIDWDTERTVKINYYAYKIFQ